MPKFARKNLKFEGMHCTSCEALIKSEVSKISGVTEIHADYAAQEGYVVYDPGKADIEQILDTVKSKGYGVIVSDDAQNKDATVQKKESKYKTVLGFSAIALGLFAVLILFAKIYGVLEIPEISAHMSHSLIFVIGLFTGFHCIAMCGGFVVSYAAKKGAGGSDNGYASHAAYGAGKLISYTAIGALFGLLGSFIAFTPSLRATIGLIAGLFLILFGLNSLNVFPFLRRFQPRMPAFISKRVNAESKQSSPFAIGLLNGLMIACGPLQAMYVFAAGTGSATEGAKVMLLFGLGTLPALLGFGIFASKISAKTTHNIIRYSGILVILLGLVMLNRALVLYGNGYDAESIASKIGIINAGTGAADPAVSGNYQTIRMDVTRNGYVPDSFTLKRGVPVKWIIDGKEITGCNKVIIVPEYKLTINVVRGEQTVEFVPAKSGTVSFSCEMGMMRGSFDVRD